MAANPRIVFHVGGPRFHPVDDQAGLIADWLGAGYTCRILEGLNAFEALDACDLLVIMGLHWTGMDADWAGNLDYHPLEERHRRAFEAYVASGRPLLAHHGAVASYDDWPRFGELLGFTWIWGTTAHSPMGDYRVRVLPTGHPVVSGVDDYDIRDELYYDVAITLGLEPAVHAQAEWEGRRLPMVMTASGGRIEGAGRTAYLANGHDMEAFGCPALRPLWINAVNWLLGGS
jgi:uncharacterized protein